MTARSLFASTMLGLGALAATAAQAQQAAKPCLPPQQAEAVMLVVAPTLVRSVAAKCTTALPANAYLVRSAPQLAGKFEAEAPAAWPQATNALKTLAGADVAGLADSTLMRAALVEAIGAKLGEEIKVKDCAAIDRVLALLDPLPARNSAALIVTIVELSQRDAKPGAKRDLVICAR